MPKKEIKEKKDAGVKVTKRTIKKSAGTKAVVPAKRTVAAAKKSPRRTTEKNMETEIQKEQKKYFARWTEKDFKRTEGEIFFYRISLIAAALGILGAAYDRNLLTMFTFLMLAVVVVFELKSESRDVEYEINMEGVMIGGKLYLFDGIKSFEIAKKGNYDVVKLQLKNAIFPMKEMYLAEGQDLRFMHALLGYFLPEETQEDRLFSFTKMEKKLTEEEYIDKKVDEYLKKKN